MEQTQQALQRVSQFYTESMAKIEDAATNAIANARQVLNENLSNIGYQRNASATAKQQSTLQAWQEYYNNVNQAKIQAATFKTQYDLWKQQQDTALAATSDFSLDNANTYNQGLQNSYGEMPQSEAPQTLGEQVNPYFKRPSKGIKDEEKDTYYNNGVFDYSQYNK
jgi:hypothetical protein